MRKIWFLPHDDRTTRERSGETCTYTVATAERVERTRDKADRPRDHRVSLSFSCWTLRRTRTPKFSGTRWLRPRLRSNCPCSGHRCCWVGKNTGNCWIPPHDWFEKYVRKNNLNNNAWTFLFFFFLYDVRARRKIKPIQWYNTFKHSYVTTIRCQNYEIWIFSYVLIQAFVVNIPSFDFAINARILLFVGGTIRRHIVIEIHNYSTTLIITESKDRIPFLADCTAPTSIILRISRLITPYSENVKE